MKKKTIIYSLLVVVLLVLAWGRGGRTGFDYSLTCTKCLDDSHVMERKFLGVTYSTKRTYQGNPSEYLEIIGRKCEHVYHKGGCGKSWISWYGHGIGCGWTAEGIVFQDRNRAVRRTFSLHQKFRNKELATRTLELIDRLLPPDFDWKATRSYSESRDRLLCFCRAFEQVESVETWQSLLEIAEHGTLLELSNQIKPLEPASEG
jgi:hypothetical protein